MNYSDGPGWSPDGGRFWIKDDIMYGNNGEVVKLGFLHAVRMMRGPGWEHNEDYSAWTPEHRASVKAKFDAERERYRKESEKRAAELSIIVASAESKLTEEELGALHQAYRSA